MEFDIGKLFIGELFITSRNITLHFLDSVDGKNKEKIISKLKIN